MKNAHKFKIVLSILTMFVVLISAGCLKNVLAANTTRGEPVEELVGADSGIQFQMFNYSENINYDSNLRPRKLSPYFYFRGDGGRVDGIRPANGYDEDAFTVNHATVERTLLDGYPVLCLTRDANGNAKTPPQNAPSQSQRSLKYLFQSGDPYVTAYRSKNTLLQYDASTGYYEYNSGTNAVDYDTKKNEFIVYENTERGEPTAKHGSQYADFLPFNYGEGTQGVAENGVRYQYKTKEIDYWFGMTMETGFMQPKSGKIKGQDMIFQFSGDDDVWVFIDGVLVLDIGGTHGVASGSINFATGKVEAYLDWDGINGKTDAANHVKNAKYYTTSIQECFEKAGKTWDENAQTFEDYSTHTLQYFYLERGSSCSNCHIKFNLQTLPENSLTITKELEGINEEHQKLLQEKEFKLQLFVQEKEGEEYKVWTKFKNLTTDEKGRFSLRSGEMATATEIPATATCYLKEYETSNYQVTFYQGTKPITAEQKENEAKSNIISVNQDSISLVVKNKYLSQQMKIQKIVSGNMAYFEKSFDFSLQIQDQETNGTTGYPLSYKTNQGKSGKLWPNQSGVYTFQLKHNESVEITLPQGCTYEVSETDYGKEGYRTFVKADKGEPVLGRSYQSILKSGVSIVFENQKVVPVPTGIRMDRALGISLVVSAIGGFIVWGYQSYEQKRKMGD